MPLAFAGAAAMIAHQVAGKAARDGFFLGVYSPADLPKMVVGAALTSVILAILFTRVLERFGTRQVTPVVFAISAALHLGEWALIDTLPRTVVLIYLHVVGLGAILLSGFWLLLSEVFDLREAKKNFGRIAGAGTAGGILGGLAAERVVSLLSMPSLLILLALLHAACALFSGSLRGACIRATKPREPVSVKAAFERTPLLWQLAALVFMGTCTAALLDYLFKLGATMQIGKGPGLVRFFAFYYTGCQVTTFLFQTLLAKPAVERLGIAKSVASLPVVVGASATAALLVPIYPLVALARALEVTLRGSLFRSGYEFLYTPVPPSDKRAVKTVIDVGCDRLGDAVGAGAVQVMVALGPSLARPEILGLSMVLSAVGTALALRLESAYRNVLERSLVERAKEDEEEAAPDISLVNTVFEGIPTIAPTRNARTERAKAAPQPVAPASQTLDPTLARMEELRSKDRSRVLRVLHPDARFDPLVVPQVIRLLAWDEVSAHARAYLERGGPRIIGQLNDALADDEMDFGIRRRIPRLLARVPSQFALDGLLTGLQDARFDIRQQCGRALEYMKRHHPDLVYPEPAIMSAVSRELSVTQAIWRSRRLLEERDPGDNYDYLDEMVREHADHSLEHVFSLLAVLLPREPLLASFRALHHEDRMFRGLALEYLENVLPQEVRGRLWELIGETPPPARTDQGRVTRELIETSLRLESHLAMLSPNGGRHPKPNSGETDVDPGETRHAQR